MTGERITTDPPLADLRRQLREADLALPKELQKEHKEIARSVGDRTRSKYLAAHGGGEGRGAASIRPRATQTSASIAMGGPRAPYVLGQNFGSNQGPRKRQFPTRRKPDYFLYTTIEEQRSEIERRHGEAVDRVMRKAFPDGAS